MIKQEINWHAPKLIRLTNAPQKNCLIPTEIETGPFGYNGSVHLSSTLTTENGNQIQNDWCDGQLYPSYQQESIVLSWGARESNREADGPS